MVRAFVFDYLKEITPIDEDTFQVTAHFHFIGSDPRLPRGVDLDNAPVVLGYADTLNQMAAKLVAAVVAVSNARGYGVASNGVYIVPVQRG